MLFVLKQPVIAGLTIIPKVKPAQPRALPHGKKDGPWRNLKNVALLLVSSKITLLDSFSGFQIFGFSVTSKEFLASKWSYASKIGLSIIKL